MIGAGSPKSNEGECTPPTQQAYPPYIHTCSLDSLEEKDFGEEV